MDDIERLFRDFGGPAKVGKAIGVSTEHAAAMKRRKSIPVDYWPALIDEAERLSLHGISYKMLALLHARQHDPATPQDQAGAA